MSKREFITITISIDEDGTRHSKIQREEMKDYKELTPDEATNLSRGFKNWVGRWDISTRPSTAGISYNEDNELFENINISYMYLPGDALRDPDKIYVNKTFKSRRSVLEFVADYYVENPLKLVGIFSREYTKDGILEAYDYIINTINKSIDGDSYSILKNWDDDDVLKFGGFKISTDNDWTLLLYKKTDYESDD